MLGVHVFVVSNNSVSGGNNFMFGVTNCGDIVVIALTVSPGCDVPQVEGVC